MLAIGILLQAGFGVNTCEKNVATKEKTHNELARLWVPVSSQPLEDWIYLRTLCALYKKKSFCNAA